MRESGLLTREPAEHDRRVMRVLLTDKGRTMRQPLEEMWSALEWASVTDLDAVKQFMVTSAVSRREIVDRYSPASTQSVVTDGGGHTHNQKAVVQT